MTSLLVLSLAAGAGFAAWAAYRLWPVSPEREHARLLARYMAESRANGLTVDEAMSDIRVREAFARLRRRATEETLACPRLAEKAIARIGKEEAKSLALISRDEAKRFVKWVESVRIEDILYPEAVAAWDAGLRAAVAAHPSERTDQDRADSIAALRVLKD